jgi:hypothetical protein
MQAHKSVKEATRNARTGRKGKANSSWDGRLGSIWAAHPTDGTTPSLGVLGAPRLYFLLIAHCRSAMPVAKCRSVYKQFVMIRGNPSRQRGSVQVGDRELVEHTCLKRFSPSSLGPGRSCPSAQLGGSGRPRNFRKPRQTKAKLPNFR